MIDSLVDRGDCFLVLSDYQAYRETQDEVEKLYKNPEEWYRKALLNVARIGKFSSDRTIRDYAEEIWKVEVNRGGIPDRHNSYGQDRRLSMNRAAICQEW